MKYLNEFYQSYKDYKNSKSKFGTPEDLLEDALISINPALPNGKKDIDSISDESSDKGIKFKIVIGKDVVHMYKVGSYRYEWEFYLNKRKSSKYEISNYFADKLLSPYEKVLRSLLSYDFTTDYIDSGSQYKKATESNNEKIKEFNKLSKSDKNKVIKSLIKSMPNQANSIKRIFIS